MSAHLLPVTAVWLARLPSGVALFDPDRGYLGRTVVDRVGHVYVVGGRPWTVRADVFLDLHDTVTAAAVAARIVRPWLMTASTPDLVFVDGPEPRVLSWGCTSTEIGRALDSALWMTATPADRDALTRLARAAMEGA